MRCLGFFVLLFSRTNADLSFAHRVLPTPLLSSHQICRLPSNQASKLAGNSLRPFPGTCSPAPYHSLTHYLPRLSSGCQPVDVLERKASGIISLSPRQKLSFPFILSSIASLFGSTRAGPPSLSFHRCRCLTLPRHCAWPNTEYSIAIPYLNAASPPLFWSLALFRLTLQHIQRDRT